MYVVCFTLFQDWRHWGGGGAVGVHGPPPPPGNQGNQGKKERFSKQKQLKGCHQGQNVTILAILECLEFKNFLVGQPWWPTILLSVPWPL